MRTKNCKPDTNAISEVKLPVNKNSEQEIDCEEIKRFKDKTIESYSGKLQTLYGLSGNYPYNDSVVPS